MEQRNNKIWLWFGWSISSFFVLFQFLLQTSASVMVPDLKKAFDIDLLGVSWLASSFFYTYLFLQIPSGLIVDRFGVRITLTVGLLLAAFASFLFATTSFLSLAVTSRILLGIASAPGVVSALYLTARCFPARYFALIAGLMECLCMLGGVAGESLMARSVHHLGWRETMLICGTIALLMSVLAWFFLRDRFVSSKDETHAVGMNDGWKNVLSILRMRDAWINGLFSGMVFAILSTFAGFWCISYLMDRFHVPLSLAADASAIIFLGAAIGAPLIGWMSDHRGQRRPLMIILSGLLFLLMTVILYAPIVSFSWIYLLLFFVGVCSGVYVLPFAVMRDITPSHMRATAMGYTNMMCIMIGAPLLQPLIGWLLTQKFSLSLQSTAFSDYQYALLCIPISLFIAWVLAFFVRDVKLE